MKLPPPSPRASSGQPLPPHLPGPRIRGSAPASGAEREDREARLDAPGVGETSTREGKERSARCTSPPAAGPVWGLPAGSRGPLRGCFTPVSHSSPQSPTRLGAVEGRWLYLPQSPTFANKLPSPSSRQAGDRSAREKPCTPRGTRGGDSPPPSAPGFSGWGSEEPHGRPRATAVPGAGAARNRWSAPTGSRRASPCTGRLGLRFPSRPRPDRQQQAPLSRLAHSGLNW